MRGCDDFASAARFCAAFEEQRQYFWPVTRSGDDARRARLARHFQERWAAVMAELVAA